MFPWEYLVYDRELPPKYCIQRRELSDRRELPSCSPKTVREPLGSYGSYRPVEILYDFVLFTLFLPLLVDKQIKLDNVPPSLHPHYREIGRAHV